MRACVSVCVRACVLACICVCVCARARAPTRLSCFKATGIYVNITGTDNDHVIGAFQSKVQLSGGRDGLMSIYLSRF